MAKVHPTAWLDGVRGVASFIVFIHHSVLLFYFKEPGYGSPTNDGGQYTSLWRLPFIRLIYGGPMAVSLFYVVSGYALSIKPVRQMRKKDYSGLYATLQSSIFRRPFRLFLPIGVVSLAMVFFGRLGLFSSTLWAYDKSVFWHTMGLRYQARDTLREDLVHWAHFMLEMGLIHISYWRDSTWAAMGSPDSHLWTIPVEFYASLALFTIQIAVGGFKSWIRMTMICSLILVAIYRGWSEMILFFGGMFLCEGNAILDDAYAPGDIYLNTSQRGRQSGLTRQHLPVILHSFNIIVSLYLLSMSSVDASRTPGYRWLHRNTPPAFAEPWMFWTAIGALLLVGSLSRVTYISWIFSSGICRYLGRISYPMYLLHGPLTTTLGMVVWNLLMTHVSGKEGFWRPLLGAQIPGFLILMTVLIWGADVFARLVDEPLTRVTKRFEERCLAE